MTAVVTGLRIRRRTEPWQGNGFTTSTLWTAAFEGEVIGEWRQDMAHACWVLIDGERVPYYTSLASWRAAVVREAEHRRYGP